MLFGSTMLEVAIGMIFVYLLMSLLCSAFGELINSVFRFRSKDLERGIRRLLNDTPLPRRKSGDNTTSPPAEESLNLGDMFFNHPLIKPLYEGRKPSYIPSRTFSLALWNMATGAAKQGAAANPPVVTSPPTETVGDVVAGVEKNLKLLRDTIQALPPNLLPRELKQSFIVLIDEAGSDFDKARANVEKWYDDAMDRVSGSFRRRSQYILLGLGFALSLGMNVDSFNIIKTLYTKDDVRKAVVTVAEKYASEPLPGTTPTPTPAATPTPKPTPTPTPTTPPAGGAASDATTPPSPTPSPTPTAQEQFDAARERINQIKGEIGELGLPIGWDCEWREPSAKEPAGAGQTAAGNTNGNANANGNSNANQNANTNANANANASPGGEAKGDAGEGKKWMCSPLTAANPRGVPSGWRGWLFKLAGIFLTALAVSQGAPFWFDLLNKFIVVRSTVKPQEKSQTRPSKDKPAPETEEQKKKTGDGS